MFRVHVTKDYTVFCSGHFITYEGDKCEGLHGHNYRAAVTLEGALNENAYVFDFVRLKKLLRAICDRLDHKMLLPQHNPLLTLTTDEASITVRYRERVYVFPLSDVVLLPIPNTTAEMLAQWIAGELETGLREHSPTSLEMLEVEVEESFGQSAFFRKTL
ncbi:MAG: 6-pyruvoyl trahydropterin synthase family protein [Anaerolineales bacterium]